MAVAASTDGGFPCIRFSKELEVSETAGLAFAGQCAKIEKILGGGQRIIYHQVTA
jgi:hypothetical protein